MTQDRRRTPRTTRSAVRPAHVVAAGAVLLTAAAIAVGQAFGLQAALPAPTVAAPAATPQATSAPTAQQAAVQRAAVQRAAVQRVAASAASTPSSSATPTPTPDTPTATPTAAATPGGASTPTPTPTAAAPTPSVPAPAPSPTAPAPVPSPSTAPVAMTPGLFGGPAALAPLGDPGTAPTYLPAGQPLTGLLPFQTFRVVVQLGNGGPGDVAVAPRLEYRLAGTSTFLVVPDSSEPGTPLNAAEEWVPVKGGTLTAPESTTTTPDEAQLTAPDGAAQAAGHRLSGAQAAPRYTVAAGTVTEQEFTAALSIDAPYGATYELRVTDAGAVIDGTALVTRHRGRPAADAREPGTAAGLAERNHPGQCRGHHARHDAGLPPGVPAGDDPDRHGRAGRRRTGRGGAGRERRRHDDSGLRLRHDGTGHADAGSGRGRPHPVLRRDDRARGPERSGDHPRPLLLDDEWPVQRVPPGPHGEVQRPGQGPRRPPSSATPATPTGAPAAPRT